MYVNVTVLRSEQEEEKALTRVEAQLYWLAEQLGDQRAATLENIERRQARTVDEREKEGEEDAAGGGGGAGGGGDSDDDAKEEAPYNPKDVPLGWDGKPIPYWLYKLHGLNLYFNCEICGNATYRGPLAFQRHFTVCFLPALFPFFLSYRPVVASVYA